MSIRFRRYGDPPFDVAFSYSAADAAWVEPDPSGAGYVARMHRLKVDPHRFDSVQTEQLSEHLSTICSRAKLSVVLMSENYSKLWKSSHIPDFYLPLPQMEKRQTLLFVTLDGTLPDFTHELYERNELRRRAPVVDLTSDTHETLARLMLDSLGLNRNLVFLSYRHIDAGAHAGKIHEGLVNQFHQSLVFFDHRSVEHDSDLQEEIEEHLERTKVLVVIVGERWLGASENGEKRLFQENDWVRREIRYGLNEEQVRVLLVLLNETERPLADQLPRDISGLSALKPIKLRSARWAEDLRYLAGRINDITKFPTTPAGQVAGLGPE